MDDTKTTKRVLAIGDLHCGNRVGLTPPTWNYKVSDATDKYAEIREECWDLYTDMVDKYRPKNGYHLVVANGDLIEGAGYRPLGNDVLFRDRHQQCDAAQECLEYIDAKHIIIVRGTPYHVGERENYEDNIARHVKARKIGDEETFKVNGVVWNCKHLVGRSSIPHGRSTPILRSRLNNLIWAEDKKLFPKAQILIRSHVHYFHAVVTNEFTCMTLPSLTALGGAFGSRIPDEAVDWGVVWFDITDENTWSWDWDIVLGEAQKTEVIEL